MKNQVDASGVLCKKFVSLMAVMSIFMGPAVYADSYQDFFGYGSCRVQSPECASGQSISCSAAGPSGGYCFLEEDADTYRVECKAFSTGGSSVNSRACVKAIRGSRKQTSPGNPDGAGDMYGN